MTIGAADNATKGHHFPRCLAIGAEVVPGGVHFRLWAPDHRTVEVVLEGSPSTRFPLTADGDGHFAGLTTAASAGTRYRFRLDGSDKLYPDPASRYQPQGPHGPSQVVDPTTFHWSDARWKGAAPDHQVVYEMHIGTFTPQGTWNAAEQLLPDLKDLGITCIELMPVSEFAGRFNWGYDGVDIFAPEHHYGSPDDFRHFIDTAHALGIAAILDVVYNHLGADGNYLSAFARDYFSDKHKNDWGKPFNFDGPNSCGVREFFLANVQYWITEYHLDGFRFDATQALLDESPEHICRAISKRAREAAGERSVYLVNENEPQHTRLVRPIAAGGMGMDALWNDDFHHTAIVALTGRREAYYTDYLGSPQELISCAKWGYLYQGQRYLWQKIRRGTPTYDLSPSAFINYLQNHDQIANSGRGLRIHDLTSPQNLRALTALMLLFPQTPMLFQGEEYAAPSPFYYFADHEPELAQSVRKGRAGELAQFPTIATPAMQPRLPNPADEQTFLRSKLDPAQRHQPRHAEQRAMVKQLLHMRQTDGVLCYVQRRGDLDGAVLGPRCLALRYFGKDGDDRLVICDYGQDLPLLPAPEPLLAPPPGKRWAVLFTSEDPAYGGSGMPIPETENEGWLLLGGCTTVLKPVDAAAHQVPTRIVRSGVASVEQPAGEP